MMEEVHFMLNVATSAGQVSVVKRKVSKEACPREPRESREVLENASRKPSKFLDLIRYRFNSRWYAR